ncbi:hypothetical protein LXL04_000036 [Taraxacum kok-saghyz]
MVKEYLGDDIFQKSLSCYMKKYAFKNAKTEDLWSVLSEESGFEVNKLMDIWTKQTGYPVIHVKLENNTLEFHQTRFMSLGLQSEGQWIVPITLSLGSYTGEESILSLLSLMDLYRDDLDYLVLSRLISVCYSVANILKDAIYDPWNHMNQFFIDLIISSSHNEGSGSVLEEIVEALCRHVSDDSPMVRRVHGYKDERECLRY